ncbi:22455_t:CDS:2 [Cetraspora pellucida]|uniref:22455_t:CDS:1 n=1 Tax=Cetraspora pellucida TaxID=1433469 RepID=A0A9N8VQQ3_9GLOM|nr:22455_t:CDS:2 [Cetraspora pellucida]
MAKILKCSDCDRIIKTDKTRDLNKHMNLNENLRKGQCQPALLIMKNVGNITLEQNTPQTENITSEQNLLATPKGDFISFDENLPTFQPRKATNNEETIMEAYKRINNKSEAIAKKTNNRIDISSARKRISEIVKPLEDQVKHIYTDGFIIAEKVELKMGIEMEIPNLIIFKENKLCFTNSLPDFKKIQQDKKQNTILNTEYSALQIAKRKLSKKSDINLLNEIIIEIF